MAKNSNVFARQVILVAVSGPSSIRSIALTLLMGRKKIAIVPIEDERSRQVCIIYIYYVLASARLR